MGIADVNLRFVSWFSRLMASVGVFLAGKELNARPWPELLQKGRAGIPAASLLAHRALSV